MEIKKNRLAARNERFVEKCLAQINTACDAEEGMHRLLKYLGEALQCERVYVFEEMDRQHICNTYEWCSTGTSSGIKQLPYLSKKDLQPWYDMLISGENIIEPDVQKLQASNPLIYEILHQQQISTIILSPLLSEGRMVGLLGADNPPAENMEHISVLFDVLAYFVSSLVSQRELQRLRKKREIPINANRVLSDHNDKTVLLVDDSEEMLHLNERVLRQHGYCILKAGTLHQVRSILSEKTPDVIVLDIDLPDGSGVDFCRELNGSIPVIFLTARSEEEAAKEGIEAGGSAFLTKPYEIQELQKAVAEAVKRNSGHVHLSINESISSKEEINNETKKIELAGITAA